MDGEQRYTARTICDDLEKLPDLIGFYKPIPSFFSSFVNTFFILCLMVFTCVLTPYTETEMTIEACMAIRD